MHEIRNVIGYFGSEENGISPAEITPRKGARFIFADTWWAADEEGNIVDRYAMGNELTFGDQPFSHGIRPRLSNTGTYYIGIMAVDMDGVE